MTQHNEQSGMRNFLIIAIGQIVSMLGTGLTNFAISLWVLQHTGSVTQFGLLILIITLPGFFVTPLAGVAVDRWSRRTVMILSDVGAGLSILLLSLLFFAGFMSVWVIAVALAISSVCAAFRSPAYLASVSLLVPKQHLGRANGIIQLGEGLGKILAPLLAGFLLVAVQVQGVILIDVFSFFFAAATLFIVRIPNPRAGEARPEKPGLLREAVEGWQFIKARPGMVGLLVFFAFLSFQMGMTEVLVPPMLLASASPTVVGTVVSVFGFGLLVGSIAMSIWAGPRRRIYGVYLFAAVHALALVIAGGGRTVWVMGAGLFLWTFSMPLVNGCMRVIYQLKTPPEMQGRVFATASMIVQAVMPLAFVISGPLADKVFEPMMAEGGALAGSVGQLIGVGKGRGIGLMLMLMGLTVLAGVVVGFIYPRLRRIETELPDAFGEQDAAAAPTLAPDETQELHLEEVSQAVGIASAAPHDAAHAGLAPLKQRAGADAPVSLDGLQAEYAGVAQTRTAGGGGGRPGSNGSNGSGGHHPSPTAPPAVAGQSGADDPLDRPTPTTPLAHAAGLLLLLVLLACISIYWQRPPAAVPATAPPADFSAERALKHAAVVGQSAHPVGSAAHAAVREYLLGELRAAGLEPQVQTTTAVNLYWGAPYTAGTVNNVVARLAGTQPTKAVLLVSHYDSVPHSPGAGDDGAGVATLLEVLRALKSGPAPRNDVIFLFTDAEEVGLLGAEAFVRNHPWAKDAGLVLNFEARGSRGPSFMFETSNGNGWLLQEFAAAVPHPITNSLLSDVYRVLPNDTDLSAFKRAGLPGLNFAFFDGAVNYHTARDSVEELDPRSLQHQGSYALALARRFGELPLRDRPATGDTVYFNVFGSVLARYPAGWALPLAVGLVVLLAVVFVIGLKKRRLTLRGLVAGFFVHLLSMVVSAVAVTLLWALIRMLHPAYDSNPFGDTFNSGLYMIAFAATAVACTALLYAWLGRKVRAENLAAGALLWWLLPAVLTSLALPGMSYLFAWPLLFALLGFGYWLRAGAGEGQGSRPAVVLFLSALPGVLLLSPTIHMLYEALTLGASAVVMIFVVLLVGLLVPHFGLVADSRRWLVPGLAAATAAAFIVAGSLTAGVSRQSPRQDNVFYGLNADTGRAVWASVDEGADEWTAQFFKADATRGALTEYLPQSSRSFLQSPAPAAALAPPAVELLEDKVENNRRLVRLRLDSPRGASATSLFLDPGVEVTRAELNGVPLPTAQAQGGAKYGWGFYYHAPPAGGVTLTLEIAPGAPLHVRAVDRSYGLPSGPDFSVTDRPEHLIPSAYVQSDSTLVTKSYTF